MNLYLYEGRYLGDEYPVRIGQEGDWFQPGSYYLLEPDDGALAEKSGLNFTLIDVPQGCGELIDWLRESVALEIEARDPKLLAQVLREQSQVLIEDAAEESDRPLPADVPLKVGPLTISEIRQVLKRLRQWEQTAAPPQQAINDQVTPEAAGMTWQEAATRLEQLRKQGEAFTSQHQLAKNFHCSSGTIHKAIRNTKSLQGWAKQQAVPRPQILNDMVTDHTAQKTEPDPADDAAIREYLERDLTLEERAFFNSLSLEDQIEFLNDPDEHGLDEHPRVLGRKP